MGASMRVFKLQALSLFKLPLLILGENRSLKNIREQILCLNEQLSSQKQTWA